VSEPFDRPRWPQEEPDEASGEVGLHDGDDEAPSPTADEGLDHGSENVFEEWSAPLDDPELAAPEADVIPAADEAELPPAGPAALRGPGVEEDVERSAGTSEHAPGELTVPPGISVLDGAPRGERRAVGVVVGRFNGDVTSRLLQSAVDELAACGVAPDAVTVMPVPGAFELPLAAMALAKTRRFACIVALGCVIRGDTPHFDYVAGEAASGLQLAAIETGVPVAFGVLTLDRADQADARVDKGAEAVRTALEMADLFANLRAAAAR
jgi:6,7-dimethyl-8-ribityllumazine synthase